MCVSVSLCMRVSMVCVYLFVSVCLYISLYSCLQCVWSCVVDAGVCCLHLDFTGHALFLLLRLQLLKYPEISVLTHEKFWQFSASELSVF